MKLKKINVGGQAVIEGVMIRGPLKYTVAVRKRNKQIVVKKGVVAKNKPKIYKLPLIRGFVNLVEMLIIGTRSLLWSAEQSGEEGEKIGKNELFYTLLMSIGAVVIFFVGLPYYLTHLAGFSEEQKPILFNLVDGLIRIIFFLGYIYAISFMKDVKRLFQYHGAEHKAIHCYEHDKELNVKNVQKFTTLHPSCGTSFLLLVFIISILAFSILPSLVTWLSPYFSSYGLWTRKGILFPLRILFIPIIAGISYEILKLSDKKKGNFVFKVISFPGLMLQKITTQEPDNKDRKSTRLNSSH